MERVKELMSYNELTLSEIAYKMHFSSVAYLSNQFKSNTGISSNKFKSLKSKSRKGLETLLVIMTGYFFEWLRDRFAFV